MASAARIDRLISDLQRPCDGLLSRAREWRKAVVLETVEIADAFMIAAHKLALPLAPGKSGGANLRPINSTMPARSTACGYAP